MPIEPLWIFLLSLGFNVAVKLATPFLGRFRSGIDSLLFCTVATAFVGGAKVGLVYGFLISIAYYAISSRRWHHAAFVIPMVSVMGLLAGLLHSPLVTLGLIIFFVYHIISFAVFNFLRSAGPGYAIFVILNFVTTYALLQLAEVYLI